MRMPNVYPGAPVAPGIAQPGQFPQYGVGGGTPGSSAGWKVVTATDEAQKEQEIQQGYLVWFSSQSAAQNYISSESSGYGSGQVPSPLSGVAAIGDFFSRLTQKNTWVRVGEVVIGLVLLGIGVNALFKGAPLKAVTGAAGTVGKVVP